jgi:hypothetical protein
MTVFMPPINLDDHATPWAKAIQQRMDDVELAASRSTNDGENANSTAVATLNSIAKQIASILQNQTALATAQATLASTVSGLANVVSLLGSISATAIFNDGGMALSTPARYAYLTVPPGMTKISYTAFAFGSGKNSTASAANLLIFVTGPTGSSGIATVSVTPGATQYASSGTVGSMSGLTPGDVMSFQTGLTTSTAWAANSGNTLNLQVLGVFQP